MAVAEPAAAGGADSTGGFASAGGGAATEAEVEDVCAGVAPTEAADIVVVMGIGSATEGCATGGITAGTAVCWAGTAAVPTGAAVNCCCCCCCCCASAICCSIASYCCCCAANAACWALSCSAIAAIC